jgi:hypothetical protein
MKNTKLLLCFEGIFFQVETTYFQFLFQSPSNPITSHLIKSFHLTSNQFKTSWISSQQHAPRPHKLRHFKIHQITSHRSHLESFHVILNRFTLYWIVSHYIESFHIILNRFTLRRINSKLVESLHNNTILGRLDISLTFVSFNGPLTL